MEYYFAYGSNLESKRMAQRCPSARRVGKAVLNNHKLNFPLYDSNWKGGVAGVTPEAGTTVEGVVYEVSPEDLILLDRHEDVHRGDYIRTKHDFELSNGSRISAWIYLPGRIDEVPRPPSIAYKRALVRGAMEHDLSKEYLRFLRTLPARNSD